MLILEGEKGKLDTTLSDLSGAEIKCHYNNIEGIFKAVRPFFFQMRPEKRDSEMDALEFKTYVQEYFEKKRGAG